jgi:trans-2,3-dihydro-3-hydroxyanthranilate isomerase
MPQKPIRFVQADVFTDTVFGGNPVAVIPDAEGLTARDMQRIAREMNLSETVFVLPPKNSKAQFRLRFFTPTEEIPFAGHPSLGTFYVLARLGRLRLTEPVTRVVEETALGLFPIEVEVRDGEVVQVGMTQARPKFSPPLSSPLEAMRVAGGLSLPVRQIADRFPIQGVSTGLPVLMVPVKSLKAMNEIRVHVPAVEDLCRRHKVKGILVFTFMTVDPNSTVHARMFGPLIGILEDPATGSASGALGAYLVHHNAVAVQPVTTIRCEQGLEMGRPSSILIEVTVRGSEIREVKVRGQAVIVVEGTMSF